MAEVFDFGLQQHKIKMDGKFFENNLFAVAGDTGRRLEVQLLDSNNIVQNTTGISLRLNADVAGQATYAEATLVDATKGLYELDLPNGMLIAPGNWQFQWQIIDANDKKLHSFAFTGSVGSNLSEGGTEATNFYLNADELKQMQDDLINGTFNSEVLETNIAEKLNNLEEQYAPKLTEVTAQLAQTDDQLSRKADKLELDTVSSSITFKANKEEVRLKNTKIAMADMSDGVISAISGGATVNVLSIPQDESVTETKLDKSVSEKINQNKILFDLLNRHDRTSIWNENGGIVNYNTISIPSGSSGLYSFFGFFKEIDKNLIGSKIRLHFKLHVDNQEMIAADVSKLSCVIGTINNGVTSNPITNIGITNKITKVNGNFITSQFEYTIKPGDTSFYSAVQIRNSVPLTSSALITAQELYYETIEMPPTEINTNATMKIQEIENKIDSSKFYLNLLKNFDSYKKYTNVGTLSNSNNITILAGNSGNASVIKYIKKIGNESAGTTFKVRAKVDVSNDEFSITDFSRKFDVQLDILNGVTQTENVTQSKRYIRAIGNNSFEFEFEYTQKNGDTELQPSLRIGNGINVTRDTSLTLSELIIDVVKPNGKNTTSTLFFNELASNLSKKGKPSQIVVAAYNSSEEDKKIADYVCDGINDEVELNKALNVFEIKSGKVLLCNGDYYIDALWDSGNPKYGRYAFPIKGPGNTREVIIEGMNAPLRDKYKTSLDLTISPVLRLRKELYDSLSATEQVTIIGSLPILSTGDLSYPGISMIVKNVGIVIPDNKKKITLIDGKYASNFKVDSIVGAPNTSSYSGPYTEAKLPVIDCIGIRGLQGYNFGEGYRMDNCFMYGMGVGFDICGEHLIANNLGSYNCLWNYRFGHYDEGRVSSHPNTLINCCGEQSVNDVLFVKSPGRQTIQMIDYNMEVMPISHGWAMNPSVEETKGQFNGRITYSPTDENYVNSGNIPFWETGHGVNFETINTASLLSGASIDRPMNPNFRQKYWDTTLNKEINWIGDVWLDAMGNPV